MKVKGHLKQFLLKRIFFGTPYKNIHSRNSSRNKLDLNKSGTSITRIDFVKGIWNSFH